MSFAPENRPLAKPEAFLRVPLGMSSPLWGLFAGAAMGGAAWWWMTRWARPENLEATFGKTAAAETVVEAEVAVLEAPVAEPVEAALEPVTKIVEAAVEPAVEVVEAALETEAVMEAIVEPPALSEPVGGEAASFAPALAAVEPAIEPAPAPKPRANAKKAPPKATDLDAGADRA